MTTIRNKILKYACILPCITLLLSSCKKFIEIPPPQTQLASSTIFEEKYSAIAAVTGIYGSMYARFSFLIHSGLSSDEFVSYSSDLYTRLYKNTLTANEGSSLIWGNAYNFIYQANAAIDGIAHSSGLSSDIKNQLMGEAKFIRAYWYFYLVNSYGEVPLVLNTDYTTIVKLSRSPRVDIYTQIISDLKDAQTLLDENYLDSQNAPTQDRVRPTKWVATALLARVYLFNKDFKNAALESSKVINNKSTFQLVSDLNGVFLKNSSEAIWQMMPVSGGRQTQEGSTFILTTAPSSLALSPQLLAAFEENDKRRDSWINSLIVAGTTYYYPYKYKVKNGAAEVTEYSMVLRLAEQYLIRSEARVQLNNLKDAAADLDSIRLRAGLLPTTATTKSSLLDAILHERQVELFTEGHRWLDLKCANVIDQVMTKVTPEKGGGKWQSYQQLYPISNDDIRNSDNLKQNPGY